MFGSIFVASMIFTSKKLQVHPNRLIGFTCLSEAISCFNGVIWTMGTKRIINYLDMNQVWSWTCYFSTDPSSYDTATKVLTYSNDFSFQYFSLLTLFLNSCLCIDLILTLKSPFTPAKNRMAVYLASSAVLCIPLTYLTMSSLDVTDDENHEIEQLVIDKDLSNLILCSLLSLYLLIAIYSCIFASRRLDRKGINKVIR
jgi:hypothetical protein